MLPAAAAPKAAQQTEVMETENDKDVRRGCFGFLLEFDSRVSTSQHSERPRTRRGEDCTRAAAAKSSRCRQRAIFRRPDRSYRGLRNKAHPIPDASEAEVLRTLMTSNDLSQSSLARQVGISQSTISAVLAGTRPDEGPNRATRGLLPPFAGCFFAFRSFRLSDYDFNRSSSFARSAGSGMTQCSCSPVAGWAKPSSGRMQRQSR